MSTRLDVLTPRTYTGSDGQERTAWTRLGSAWAEPGKGIWVTLDALPTASIGRNGQIETRMWLTTPKPRDEQQSSTRQEPAQRPQCAQQPQTGYDTRQPANAPQQAAGRPQQQNPPHVEPEPDESGTDDIPFT